jgi:hypothetical protein
LGATLTIIPTVKIGVKEDLLPLKKAVESLLEELA